MRRKELKKTWRVYLRGALINRMDYEWSFFAAGGWRDVGIMLRCEGRGSQ